MSKENMDCCPPPEVLEESAGGVGRFNPERFAAFARALGHPARVAIIRLLLRKKACICGEIVDELPLAQSTVSQHLKTLKAADLIRGEVDGPRVCYCVEPAAIAQFKSLAELLDAFEG